MHKLAAGRISEEVGSPVRRRVEMHAEPSHRVHWPRGAQRGLPDSVFPRRASLHSFERRICAAPRRGCRRSRARARHLPAAEWRLGPPAPRSLGSSRGCLTRHRPRLRDRIIDLIEPPRGESLTVANAAVVTRAATTLGGSTTARPPVCETQREASPPRRGLVAPVAYAVALFLSCISSLQYLSQVSYEICETPCGVPLGVPSNLWQAVIQSESSW